MALDRQSTNRPRDYDKTGYDERPCRKAQELVDTWSAEQRVTSESCSRVLDLVNHAAGCGVCQSIDVGGGETRFQAVVRICVTVMPRKSENEED